MRFKPKNEGPSLDGWFYCPEGAARQTERYKELTQRGRELLQEVETIQAQLEAYNMVDPCYPYAWRKQPDAQAHKQRKGAT